MVCIDESKMGIVGILYESGFDVGDAVHRSDTKEEDK
jgi:hypothetical protein